MGINKRMIRRMGYLRDQEGILNRYLREQSLWDPHLMRTREFIRDSCTGSSFRSAAILGSGWLLDVPLEELRERFETLFLVDILHPPQIRKKTEGMGNVKLVEADLTGGAVAQLWKLAKNRQIPENLLNGELFELRPPLDHLGADIHISVNLLNQLDIILLDFLLAHRRYQQLPLDPLRRKIQAFHLEWITRTPGCLVTDTREIALNDNGDQTSIHNLIHTPLPRGIRREYWTWEFDTRGTYRSGSRTRMEVEAVEWN